MTAPAKIRRLWAAAVQGVWSAISLIREVKQADQVGQVQLQNPGPSTRGPAVAPVPDSERKSVREPKVAVVCGALPREAKHLQFAGLHVPLVVYRSTWNQPGASVGSAVLDDVLIRDFRPLRRSRRGQLAFLYPGMGRALKHDQPDVLHVISEPWGLLAVQAAWYVRRHTGIALVLHGCDTIWHHGGRAEQVARRLMLRWTLPVTDAWVAENGKALDLAIQHGLRRSSQRRRIHTNPRDEAGFALPTASERSAARRWLELDDDTVAIGFAGRLVPEKGIEDLLSAMDVLMRGRSDEQASRYRLFVAGNGPCSDLLREPRADVRWLHDLKFPEGVGRLMAGLDVVACPSRSTSSWEDQGPRVVVEAMMRGCIPVGTNTGGIPELMAGHGVLVSPSDPLALVDGLVQAGAISRDPMAREAVAAYASGGYSVSAVGLQLTSLWRDLITSRPGSHSRELAAPGGPT